MNTWRNWQARTPWLIGGLLFLTPWVFGVVALGSRSWWSWILATVIGVIAVSLAFLWWGLPRNRVIEALTIGTGIVVLIFPWTLGATVAVWASCLLGGLLVIATGGMALIPEGRRAWQPNDRPVRQDARRSPSSLRYRRANGSI